MQGVRGGMGGWVRRRISGRLDGLDDEAGKGGICLRREDEPSLIVTVNVNARR